MILIITARFYLKKFLTQGKLKEIGRVIDNNSLALIST